jgi:hypothetical protein
MWHMGFSFYYLLNSFKICYEEFLDKVDIHVESKFQDSNLLPTRLTQMTIKVCGLSVHQSVEKLSYFGFHVMWASRLITH